MSGETGGEKPRIIIDEDWKSQVQAEKEALAKQKQPPPAEPSAAPASPVSDQAGEQQAPQKHDSQQHAPHQHGQLPPATLTALVTMLATQALALMGQFPLPGSDKPEVHLNEAKHFIDMISMLETKTAGNRTTEESHLLENVLHELRLGFVTAGKK
jgi:uncharacterized protein DUF1844